MFYYVFVFVYILICVLLLTVVLLQQGKGGDIAAAFGGSSSQTAFGARAGATFLTRATTVLGALFLLGALGLSVVTREGAGGSVVSGVKGPAAPARTSAPALPTTAPPTTPSTTPAEQPQAQPAPAAPAGQDKAAPAPVKKGGGK